MGLAALFKRIFSGRPPKLGIAFGSGGAKGMAHLGALKAFEEAGIRFSCAAGSSIGAIVGALYAKGYTSADMVRIVETLNRREFSKNLRPFSDLSFAEEFLENYLEGDFSSLNIPFGAWVTDGATNEGVALESGKLARAVVASSAIPPFFRGVDIDGRRYYDGAFSNGVPTELVQDLGADFVVGIDLGAFQRPEEEKGMLARLFDAAKVKISPVVARMTPVRYNDDCKKRGYDHADFMLRPDLHAFRATDVSPEGMGRMFEAGYEEAKARIPELREAIKRCRSGKKRKRS